MKLNENLRTLRKAEGYTQEEIAKELEKAGISISATGYGYWEIGKNEPPISALIALANFYGVTIDYLVGRTDEDGDTLHITREGKRLLQQFTKWIIHEYGLAEGEEEEEGDP